MELPLAIAIKAIRPTLDSLFLFRNKDYDKNAPAHYHIALPTVNNDYILLTMLTSKGAKRKLFYKDNQKALGCIIGLNAGDLGGIVKDKDTVIDCNKPIYRKQTELAVIIEGSIDIVTAVIPESLLTDIARAVMRSPIAPPYIKNAIDLGAVAI